MKFTYSSGQRPLDSYTIKRGVGKGGFGEVYYAVSDGGKEVALKLIRSNLEVELGDKRGVNLCLNLKHPNLVHLFDVRTDGQGDKWVVMEYVAGESLSVVLSRHPKGLAPELARQWFLALASAIGYLHDHGVVHRDLKPANIFLENGIIKVGDYGLAKCISSSRHDAQTQSVGTVHYMAPEVGSGNYNKGIDIYAAGVILYEMLTGRVPFDGDSAAEILMKHMTTRPDLARLPREYQPVVAKALAKDPNDRYASMAEMARAVETVREEKRRAPVPPHAQPRLAVPPLPRLEAKVQPVLDALPVNTPPTSRMGELCGSMVLAGILTALTTTLWAAVTRPHSWTDMGTLFFLTMGSSWAVLLGGKFWRTRVRDSWGRRLVMLGMGVAVGASTLYMDGWVPRQAPTALVSEQVNMPWIETILPRGNDLWEACAAMSYFAVAFFVLRWWRLTERRRNHRFSFGPVLATGICSGLLLLIWPHWQAALALLLSSGIVQLVSPWEQPPPPPGKRLRLRYV